MLQKTTEYYVIIVVRSFVKVSSSLDAVSVAVLLFLFGRRFLLLALAPAFFFGAIALLLVDAQKQATAYNLFEFE